MTQLNLVNSPLDEQNPVLSPDGKRLYFTLASNDANVGGRPDRGDIWYSEWTPSGWSAPIHGGREINNSLHNTIAGFSADGTEMFLMGHYASGANPVNSQGLAVSHLVNGRWSLPENILIPYFKNLTYYQSGTVTPDGRHLIFSAESYRTRGAEDLYLSKKSADERWSEPINLGSVLNTALQDVSPFLTADGSRLYFASNGRGGLGSFDIYYADRLDGTWLHWSQPVSVPKVNTKGRELFYRMTPFGAFYTTTYNSDEYSDIVFVPAAREILPDSVGFPARDTVSSIQEIVYEGPATVKPFQLSGIITSAKTGSGLNSVVSLSIADAPLPTVMANSGSYSVSLREMGTYTIKVESPGYLSVLEKLDLESQIVDHLEMNFKLQPAEVGTTVNLKNVLFQQSTAILLPSSYESLELVVELMKAKPTIEIELSGHTDNRGYHHLNMKLSRERVEEVKKYLVSKGIAASRITGKGYGGTRPIADNDADESRQLNRRVEFTIIKD